MLHIFRKFRRRLLKTNKLSQYLFYAIGEIILVVIGILIALQINTWKAEKAERTLERNLTTRLHEEFNENLSLLKIRIDEIDLNTNASMGLMDVIATQNFPEERTLDSLLYYTIEFSPFIPNINTISEITQTGKISTLQSQELKNKIHEWTRQINSHHDIYDLFERWIEEEYIPYLTKKIAIKNIDTFGPLNWKHSSNFDNGYDKIFNEREFENIVDNHLYHLSRMKDNYNTLQQVIDEIILLTNQE